MSFNITRNATKHKKLVIGTSTTVPADGDLLVDGNVGIGVTAPARQLQVHNAGGTGGWIAITDNTSGATSSDGLLVGQSGVNSYLWNYDAGSLELATSNVARLTISSAGSITATAASAGGWSMTTSNTSATGWGMQVKGGADAGDRSFEVQSQAGASLMLVDGGGLTTVAAITETNGVLRSNLLTNSGFDVWSNSTLCNPTTGAAPVLGDAGDIVVDGTFSDAANWSVNTGWVVTGGQAVATDAASSYAVWPAEATATTVVGKLYQVTIVVSGFDKGGVFFHEFDGVSASPTIVGDGSHTFTCEMKVAYTSFQLRANGVTTLDVDSVTFHEVTPGIVSGTTAFDGWVKDSTLDIWRQHNDGGTNTKDGSFYALKGTAGAAWDFVEWQSSRTTKAEFIQQYAGRTITIGCWAKTSTASHLRLGIYDTTIGNKWSNYHTGGGAWEWLEKTATLGETITTVTPFKLYFDSSGATGYYSQPTLVYGSAIGAGGYSRPPGEIIYCDQSIDSATLIKNGYSDVSATALNLEADSNGKIPKGAKAVHAWLQVADSTTVADTDTRMYLSTSDDSRFGVDVYLGGLANVGDGCIRSAAGFVGCDSEGDIVYKINASGSGTLDVHGLRYQAVQLR